MRLLLFALSLSFFLAMEINASGEERSAHYLDFAEDEISFGQKNLYTILETSGRFSGKILLTDTPGSRHEKNMLFRLTRLVPDRHMVTWGEIIWEEVTQDRLENLNEHLWWWSPEKTDYLTRELRKNAVRVIHTPSTFHSAGATKPTELRAKMQVLRHIDALAVHSVGNASGRPHDLHYAENPHWDDSTSTYQEVESYFRSGHAILAGYAIEKPPTLEEFVEYAGWIYINITGGDVAVLEEMYRNADTYIRHPNLIQFGDLKEYGFTVFMPGRFFFNQQRRKR